MNRRLGVKGLYVFATLNSDNIYLYISEQRWTLFFLHGLQVTQFEQPGFISQSTQEHPTCAYFFSLLRRVDVLDKLQRHLYQEGFLSLSTFYFLLSLGSRYVFCPDIPTHPADSTVAVNSSEIVFE